MSSTSSTEKPAVYRKPAPDVYTVLLVIALLAIIVSCVFLCLYMAAYDQKATRAPPVSMRESGASHTTPWHGLGLRPG